MSKQYVYPIPQFPIKKTNQLINIRAKFLSNSTFYNLKKKKHVINTKAKFVSITTIPS